MPSFTSFAVLALAAFSTVIRAAPINLAERIVPISVCTTTIAKGTLRSTTGHDLHFVGGDLSFGGSLQVEFNSCQPNFGGFDGKDGRPVGGHIYVPSQGKCLTTSTVKGPPFTFSLAECEYSDDSSQTFSNFVKQSDGKIYYVGGTQVDGSYIFEGNVCASGYFGVSSSQSSGTAKFQCVNDGHIVGLNI
jgi:hypothetical protein